VCARERLCRVKYNAFAQREGEDLPSGAVSQDVPRLGAECVDPVVFTSRLKSAWRWAGCCRSSRHSERAVEGLWLTYHHHRPQNLVSADRVGPCPNLLKMVVDGWLLTRG